MTYNVFGGTLSLTQSINPPNSEFASADDQNIVDFSENAHL